MSYKLLPNGKHRWDFWLGGRAGKRVRHTDSDFKRGEREVRRMRYEFETGVAAPQDGMTLHEALDGYLAEFSLTKSHKETHTARAHVKLFKEDLPNVKLSQFNAKGRPEYNVIDEWRKKNSARTSNQSTNRYFNTLRAVFNWAIRKGYLTQNPCSRLTKLPTKSTFPRFLTSDEISRLLKASPRQEFSDYCFLILHTGMRPEEALPLSWQQIDLEKRLIYITDQKNNDKGTIPIDDALFDWLKERKRGKKVLDGYSYSMMAPDSRWAIKEAGINAVIKPETSKFTIYGLRHTFASHLLMAGVSIEEVARILRHKNINVTYSFYGHLTQQHLVKSINKVDLTGRHFVDTSKV